MHAGQEGCLSAVDPCSSESYSLAIAAFERDFREWDALCKVGERTAPVGRLFWVIAEVLIKELLGQHCQDAAALLENVERCDYRDNRTPDEMSG